MATEKSYFQPAHAGLFDDSLPLYQRLAEFIYSLGWRPDCDAQHHNLRDNLHVFVEALNPVAYRKLRDEFAAKAMHAEIVTCGVPGEACDAMVQEMGDDETVEEHIARTAYRMADAMLKVRGESS